MELAVEEAGHGGTILRTDVAGRSCLDTAVSMSGVGMLRTLITALPSSWRISA